MQATVHYLLSETGRKASLLAGGDGKDKQAIALDITPSDLEKCSVEASGAIVFSVRAYEFVSHYTAKNRVSATGGMLRVDAPITTFAEALAIVEQSKAAAQAEYDAWLSNKAVSIREELAKGQKLYHVSNKYVTMDSDSAFPNDLKDAISAFNTEAARLTNELNAKLEADRKATAEREEKAKAQRESDRLAWITTNGSDYLKKAVGAGYNCQRQYVTERCALEFPGAIVDFDNKCEWKPRTCPSEIALDKQIAIDNAADADKAPHRAEIVWLTTDASGDVMQPFSDDPYDQNSLREPFEALIIRAYLGKYDLVLGAD